MVRNALAGIFVQNSHFLNSGNSALASLTFASLQGSITLLMDCGGNNLSETHFWNVKNKIAKLSKNSSNSGKRPSAPCNQLLDRLPLEKIPNVDETGHRENKERFWTWVFKAELYARHVTYANEAP